MKHMFVEQLTNQIARLRLGILGVGLGLVLLLALHTSTVVAIQSVGNDQLQINFLNVGQGDAILITTPDGVQVLVDGGPDGAVIRELAEVLPRFDRDLDLVLATHLDKDHIGGLIDVLTRYRVYHIMETNNQHDTTVSRAWRNELAQYPFKKIIPNAGQVYVLGASTTLTIYSPAGDVSQWESNTSSIVAQVRYGNTAVLLTGDAPQGIEEYLVRAYGPHLKSDVVKLGHHGSRTSTSPNFIATASPTIAVVSAGKNNSYGHPHAEVVNTIKDARVQLLNTAEVGRIRIVSNGTDIWYEE